METGAIADRQITASSQLDDNHAPFQGRLNYQERPGIKGGAWSAANNDANQWLAIDLGHTGTIVTRIATQGRNHPDIIMEWVASYKLQYSNDLVTVLYYREQGQSEDKVNIEFIDQKLFILIILSENVSSAVMEHNCKRNMHQPRCNFQAKTKISLLWSTLQKIFVFF